MAEKLLIRDYIIKTKLTSKFDYNLLEKYLKIKKN